MTNTEKPSTTNRSKQTATGMALGIGLGVTLGAALGNVAAGLAIGIFLGGVGAAWRTRGSAVNHHRKTR